MDYMQKLENLAQRLKDEAELELRVCAYAGGVPGITTFDRIPASKYGIIKADLTRMFGEPVTEKPWHPDHTKGIPPIRWKLTPEMKSNELSHINLVSMMQRKDKQYLIVSAM